MKILHCLVAPITFCFIFAAFLPLQAKEDPVIGAIPRIEQAISVDGLLNESIWSQALEVDIAYEITPAENIAAAVATKAYLYEDGAIVNSGVWPIR